MKKRLLSAFVASCLIACSLVGCGSKGSTEKASTAASTAKSGSAANQFADEVNLTMYVVSDRPAGQDLIDENFNKLLKEKMNTTLTINWIPWQTSIRFYSPQEKSLTWLIHQTGLTGHSLQEKVLL